MAFVWGDGSITITVKTRDHKPAHVHVRSTKYEVKVDISGDELRVMPPSKKSRVKTTPKFTKKALAVVAENLELCRDIWRAKHGEI